MIFVIQIKKLIWWECCPGKGLLRERAQRILKPSPPYHQEGEKPMREIAKASRHFFALMLFLYFCAIRELKAKEILAPQDFANLLQFLNCKSTAL